MAILEFYPKYLDSYLSRIWGFRCAQSYLYSPEDTVGIAGPPLEVYMALTPPSSSSTNVGWRGRGGLELSVDELSALGDESACGSSKAAVPSAHFEVQLR